MMPFLPMVLSGDNLGQRHRYFNSQVNQAVADQVSFQEVEDLPEETAVDRLFKIELAIKLNNVDYILRTLKDDDMLYVSRALKCKWLLERRDIINPVYLESAIFPDMVIPAISKMKHWLYIHLRDPMRCQEFYQYYKDTKFEFAIKFLCHCDDEFVLKEFPDLLTKITPHYLKILAEKNSMLVKLYFDALETNTDLVKRYLEDEKIFYNNIKCILKSDPNLFLDILEKYHNYNRFGQLSPSATGYILRNHKNRFMEKSELYVVHLLHMPTVAKQLSVEECQDMVLRLARADYLRHWFSYANVEPLVKRVRRDSRAAFKKRVFVDNDIGEHIAECPYDFPTSPVGDTSYDEPHIFEDHKYEPIKLRKDNGFRKMLKKRKYCYMKADCIESCPVKSELQKLFDEFRFMGFDSTLYELKARVGATSSSDRRRDMLLVLVSKSGGRAESVRAVLQCALRLRNEPVHQRAAVVRSLVRRAGAWRLPPDVWGMLLDYGVGLGLYGAKAEAECREGLHAVVLRQLLAAGDCDPLVRTAFLNDFSTLLEYKLTSIERQSIGASLQRLLLNAASSADSEATTRYLTQLLDVLERYHINIESSSVVSAVAELTKRDSVVARPLLVRLYEAGVGRRLLLREYLEFRHDDAALVNILKHDLEALQIDWIIRLLIGKETSATQFLIKLSVYFSEKGGMAEKIRLAIQGEIIKEPDVRLARPLAILMSGGNMQTILFEERHTGGQQFKLFAALRANMHRSRPAPDALALGWRKAGVKAFATCAMRCRKAQVNLLVQSLLQEGVKRPVRLALALAQRTDSVVDFFAKAVPIHPLAALRGAVLYFRSQGKMANLQIWETVKPCLSEIDLKARVGLCYVLKKVKWIPRALKPNYCAYIFLALEKNSDRGAEYVRRDLMLYLPEVTENLLDKVLSRMLANMDKANPESYPAIVIRYLMLSKNLQEQNMRFQSTLEPFLKNLDGFRDEEDQLKRCYFAKNVAQIVETLQYNFAFFDVQYQSCISVIERILKWLNSFLPKEIYFNWYVKIHATMLYFKAIRQSMKRRPEIFEDVGRKISEGVTIVGFTLGRYISREVAQLKSQYFESVIEMYNRAFIKYLDDYIMFGRCRSKFAEEIIKGILAESKGTEIRLGYHLLREHRFILDETVTQEIKEIIMKNENVELQMLLLAEQ